MSNHALLKLWSPNKGLEGVSEALSGSRRPEPVPAA